MTSVAVARGDAIAPPSTRSSLQLAWALVVLLTVPEIVLRSFLRIDTSWMLAARIVVIMLTLGMTFVSDAARPLRGMTIVFLVIYGVEAGLLLTVIPGTSIYASVVGGDDRVAFLAERLLRIGAVVVMIATLVVMGLRRRDMYLAVGDLRAIAEPIGVPRTPE